MTTHSAKKKTSPVDTNLTIVALVVDLTYVVDLIPLQFGDPYIQSWHPIHDLRLSWYVKSIYYESNSP